MFKRYRLVLLVTFFLLMAVSTMAADVYPRIIGGVNAQNGAWPYMVSIHFPNTTGGHGCGGTLVAPNWVVTAAHCVDDEQVNGVFVYTGIYSQSDTSFSTPIPIKRFIQHPLYNRNTFINDIALLELSWNATQQNVVLNSGGEIPGTSFALGWGLTAVNGFNSDILQYLEMPTVSNTTCSSVYEGMGLGSILDSQLCAGFFEGGKDTCQNDSGGPLLVNTANGIQQVGIVSFGASPDGSPCAGSNSYGVYTRVSSFLDFIQTYVPGIQTASTTPSETATLAANLDLHIPSLTWTSNPLTPISLTLSYIPNTFSFYLSSYTPISLRQSYSASLSSNLELYIPQLILSDGSNVWLTLSYDPNFEDMVVFTLTNFGVN